MSLLATAAHGEAHASRADSPLTSHDALWHAKHVALRDVILLAAQSPRALGERQLCGASNRHTPPAATHARPYALSPGPPTATRPAAVHAPACGMHLPSSR